MNWEETIDPVIMDNARKVDEILEKFPYVKDLAERLRERKMKVIENLEFYVEQTIKNVEKLGGKAYLAKTKEEANRIIGEIVGSEKKVVLSKSNVAYETGLREFLQKQKNEVWETDLGEFLVQLQDGWPSHIVAPSIDLKSEEAGKLIHKINPKIGKESSVEDMVGAVREFLMDKYIHADFGITGANAVSADTGSVTLVENEGNIRMDTVLPSSHRQLVQKTFTLSFWTTGDWRRAGMMN